MKEKTALCICASKWDIPMKSSGGKRKPSEDFQGTSRRICKLLEEALEKRAVCVETVDLGEYTLVPCRGCGGCYEGQRCVEDGDFNRIYERMAGADYLFFVSPHCVPVPARLCMLLEKMEQIVLWHSWRESSWRSELCGKLAGILSYGGGGEQSLTGHKMIANDTIASALEGAQLKVVPFNSRWDTGISFPALKVSRGKEKFSENFSESLPENASGNFPGIFPVPEYDWQMIEDQVEVYVEILVQTSRTLYAIL